MGSPLHNGYGPNGQPVEPMVLPSRLYLDVRGTEFIVERDSLGSFPESILAAMFPNGMSVVARTTATVDEAAAKPRTSNVSDAPSDLSTGSQSTDTDPHLVDSTAPTYPSETPPSFASSTYMLFGNIAHPYFLDKQAVIVLREDLDYFTIVKPYTPKSQITPNGPPPPTSTLIAPLKVGELKTRCGDVLLEQRQVFSALERNMHQHQGPNDVQQLIDMLCVSGFSRNANWGCRVREPNRSTVSSLALVRLEPTGQPAQSAAAQKLLLFWKKPARKCWWDGIDIYVNNTMDDIPVRIWCRRMWTLELVLV
ncbi:hypothetical protein BJ085DRAFT_13504 [Dimargaris cristalligena]|uniref:Phosphatase activator n=1 Tax=Dimargaris cristalligena TaxID=215637 RepID=A0A4P9ZZ35_9FUNG|nr:hypothetical protein BJ085DRAFT_13504 [Dimargaris cristalligena]|eukprot:RKP39024.1 hypothetical protein BJ085DRAFT_13504 [Dimargaris cristalligena]